jgi:hypothetical protein
MFAWLREHLGKIVLALVVAALGWHWFVTRPVHHAPGPIAPDEPVQVNLERSELIPFKGYTLQPLATFDIRARVLSRERYWFDRGAKLAPIDLALGWGPMSDSALLDKLDISQGQRFWRFSYSEGTTNDEVSHHASNMHLIAATPAIESSLLDVRVGQVVHLVGELVEVTGDDGFRWRSSLTRNDVGDGACELVYVEDASATDT